MNHDAFAPLMGLALGLVAGVLFYGGLYATTRLLTHSRSVGLIFAGSFLLRVAIASAGAWYVATRGGHLALLFYLFAMIGARTVLVRRIRRVGDGDDA